MINGCLDRHGCLSGTRVEKLKFLKINLVMPEDIAITSSKSDVDPCNPRYRLPKKCGQMAFQLYIVDSL